MQLGSIGDMGLKDAENEFHELTKKKLQEDHAYFIPKAPFT